MAELKKLEFKVGEIEPPKAEPVIVELGGDEYTAHCPNDYEFIALMAEIRRLEDNPMGANPAPILAAFFDPAEAHRIDKSLRGSKPKIHLLAEIIPCLMALVDHYKEAVTERLSNTEKKLKAPKGR